MSLYFVFVSCFNNVFWWFFRIFAKITLTTSIKSPISININYWYWDGERGGSVVERRTLEREVGGLKPTAAVLCPWARHFIPRKYWLIAQEAVAPSRHDWKNCWLGR